MADTKHTPLGSGLSVSDGRGYSTKQKPTATALMDCSGWRAEISGVENGSVVRTWVGATYPTKHEALSAATAKAEG